MFESIPPIYPTPFIMINMSQRKTSKYQYCENCKKKFTLSIMVRKYLDKCQEIPIYCPYCKSRDIYSVDKKY